MEGNEAGPEIPRSLAASGGVALAGRPGDAGLRPARLLPGTPVWLASRCGAMPILAAYTGQSRPSGGSAVKAWADEG